MLERLVTYGFFASKHRPSAGWTWVFCYITDSCLRSFPHAAPCPFPPLRPGLSAGAGRRAAHWRAGAGRRRHGGRARRQRHARLCQRRDRRRGAHHGHHHRPQRGGRPAREGHHDADQHRAGQPGRGHAPVWRPIAHARLCAGGQPRHGAGGARGRGQAAIRRRVGRCGARRRANPDADLSPDARERQQPGADPAPADQPQQHHQRQPRHQRAGHHRLRRQPAAPGPHHCRAGCVQRHRRRDRAPAPRGGVRPGAAGGAPD